MDQQTLALLKDGLRHVKGLVATVDKWVIAMEEKLKKEVQPGDRRSKTQQT